MKIYFISGLGADKRAFERLVLPEGYEMVNLDWIALNSDSESLESYARRMAADINPSEPFILAGLSFGGIMAVEIAKFLSPEKLILFSTVADRKSLPLYYRGAGRLELYRIVPKVKTTPFFPFLKWFFGPLDASGVALLKYFSLRSDPLFTWWALGRISTWQNTEVMVPYVHIHGELDRAFPLRCLSRVDHVIENAGHLAVFTHAADVNNVLAEVLKKA